MNQIIKSRIEEINRGKIPEGYKKTSVGIVPIEWTEHTLGDIFKFKNGINKEKEAFGQGTPIVNYTDVWKKRGLKAEDIKGRVVLSKNEIQNYEVKCGDVFFTRTSETIEEIGYSSVLLDDIENAIFSGFVLRARPYNNLVSREYHQYCYSEPQMRHEIIKRSSMTTRALTSGPMLSQVAINLPSQREQSKIAEILMKWDEAIELQEQYIQTLLSMKITYVDKFFCAPGEEKTKFDLLYKTAGEGGTPDTKKQAYYDSEDVPFVKIEHLAEKYITKIDSYISNLGLQKSGAWLVPENCLIFSNGATIGEASINKISVATKQGILGIVPSDVIDVEYFYYLVKSKYFLSKVKKITTKGTMCTAYLKDINRLSLFIHEKENQIKIAEILSSIDCLIEDEKRKVDLLKKQRKTLQQYLLNGIVRVK